MGEVPLLSLHQSRHRPNLCDPASLCGSLESEELQAKPQEDLESVMGESFVATGGGALMELTLRQQESLGPYPLLCQRLQLPRLTLLCHRCLWRCGCGGRRLGGHTECGETTEWQVGDVDLSG